MNNLATLTGATLMAFGLFSSCPAYAQTRFIGAEILEQDDSQLTYRVQYGAYSNADLRPQDLYARNDIERMLGATGLTLHVGPPHADLADAQEEMQAAHSNAHEDAFLTAYLNGALVATRGDVLDVARNHLSESELAPQTFNFRVQLGRYANDLPVHALNTFLEMGGVEQVLQPNGDHVYVTQVLNDKAAATAMLDRAKDMGVLDAFMVRAETVDASSTGGEAFAANAPSH
jgi:hypothetical protein